MVIKNKMEKLKIVAGLAFGAGLIMLYFRIPGMQIATMVGGILAAAYCLHKTFDRVGYSRNMKFNNRFGWFTGAVGVTFVLFLFLNWEWWMDVGLAFGFLLCISSVISAFD